MDDAYEKVDREPDVWQLIWQQVDPSLWDEVYGAAYAGLPTEEIYNQLADAIWMWWEHG